MALTEHTPSSVFNQNKTHDSDELSLILNLTLLSHLHDQLEYSKVFGSFIISKKDALSHVRCLPGHFRCSDNSCISKFNVCDGQYDCPYGNDEHNCCILDGEIVSDSFYCKFVCHPLNCSCAGELYSQQTTGGCEPYFINTTIHATQNITPFQCNSSEEIDTIHLNDQFPDCLGGQDEIKFTNILISRNGIGNICPVGLLPCYSEYTRCFFIHQMCLYDLDKKKKMMYCRNGNHLQKCEEFPCKNTYKCIKGYCIPYRRVCDGLIDCIHGDDEIGCDNYTCVGMLRCKKTTYCVHPVEVCDGVQHCPLGDDEVLRGVRNCPAGCKCLALAMECLHQNMTIIPEYTYLLHYLHMGGNKINVLNYVLPKYKYLKSLLLPYNYIQDVCKFGGHTNLFQHMTILVHLNLAFTRIQFLTGNCFSGVKYLYLLSLEGNYIKEVDNSPFQHLHKLMLLNLSHNEINSLGKNSFFGAENLNVLDITDNPITTIHESNLNYLSLNSLNADDFVVCCISDLPHNCDAPRSLFSSCSKLIRDKLFQLWIWITSMLCLLLNITVTFNTLSEPGLSFHKLALLKLSLSDLMYGVYLGIIATANSIYGSNYAVYDGTWRASILCHSASVLSSTSFLFSCFSLTEVAACRYFVIANHGKTNLSRNTFMKCLAVEIFFSVVLNAIPFWFYVGHFSQSSGICISLIPLPTSNFRSRLSQSKKINMSVPFILQTVTISLTLLSATLVIVLSYLRIMQHIDSVQHNLQQFGKFPTSKKKNVFL